MREAAKEEGDEVLGPWSCRCRGSAGHYTDKLSYRELTSAANELLRRPRVERSKDEEMAEGKLPVDSRAKGELGWQAVSVG